MSTSAFPRFEQLAFPHFSMRSNGCDSKDRVGNRSTAFGVRLGGPERRQGGVSGRAGSSENNAEQDRPSIAELRGLHVPPAAFLHIIDTSRLLTVLKNDTRAIFAAASHAQKAADFLKSLQPQTEEPAARLAA
jgi:antirestriction protein ArdC